MSTHEFEYKLQFCIDDMSNWYDMNRLCIDQKKYSVTVIGSKFQLRSLNLDDKLQLAKYLGLWNRNDLSRGRPYYNITQENVLFCSHVSSSEQKNSHHHYYLTLTSPTCSLRSPMDYLYGVKTNSKFISKIICNNFDYINLHGIEMAQTLKLQTVCERRDYFLCILMFEFIHGLAHHHYSDVIMSTIASLITSFAAVYSTVYSDADQRKHQSSASLAFVWGIHRDRWIPCTKGQLRGKCFHLMTSLLLFA